MDPSTSESTVGLKDLDDTEIPVYSDVMGSEEAAT